jgi:polysaccharide export outer membrane protein
VDAEDPVPPPSTQEIGPSLGRGNPQIDSGIRQASAVEEPDAPVVNTTGWTDSDRGAEQPPAMLPPVTDPAGALPGPAQPMGLPPTDLPDSWADESARQPAGQPPEQPTPWAADGPPPNRAQAIPAQAPGAKKVTQAVLLLPPKPMHHPPYPGCPVPKEFAKRSLSAYVIEPPDILLVEGTPAVGLRAQPLTGPHLVRPDGTIGLGIYGSVYVAGMTIDMAKAAVAAVIKQRAAKDLTEEQIMLELQVDVLAYNSKFYYIIMDGGGYGQQVYRLPCTGNETVLDAISQLGGLPTVSCNKRIWVARATPYEAKHPKILPVDWKSLTQYGVAATNYQIFPGDRIFVHSDPLIQTNSFLNKLLSPVERVLGTVLLGATTVTAVKTASQ